MIFSDMKIKTPGLALHIKDFVNDHLLPDDYQDWIVYSKLSVDRTKHSISTIINDNIKLKQPTVYIGFEPYLVGSHLDPERNGFSIENARGSTGGLPLGIGYDNPDNLTKQNYIERGALITTCDFQPECEYIPFLALHPRLDLSGARLYSNNTRPYKLGYMNRTVCGRREMMFDSLVKELGVERCHSLGECCGTHPETRQKITNPRTVDDSWYNDQLYEQYSRYQFIIAMENTSTPGYITEKLYNALLAGCIPVYYGDKIAKEIFNPECFINITDFETFESCAKYISAMTDQQINEMREQPMFTTRNKYIDPTSSHYDKIRLNINKLVKCYEN